MKRCPCCSGELLRHARHSGVYWFCQHCWQEMPDFSSVLTAAKQRSHPLGEVVSFGRQLEKLDVKKLVARSLEMKVMVASNNHVL